MYGQTEQTNRLTLNVEHFIFKKICVLLFNNVCLYIHYFQVIPSIYRSVEAWKLLYFSWLRHDFYQDITKIIFFTKKLTMRIVPFRMGKRESKLLGVSARILAYFYELILYSWLKLKTTEQNAFHISYQKNSFSTVNSGISSNRWLLVILAH